MKYECTDCVNCASFDFGFRVYCLYPLIAPESIEKYLPVGNLDAIWCSGFDEGEPLYFSMEDITSCENDLEKAGKLDYNGIREWCAEKKRERGDK